MNARTELNPKGHLTIYKTYSDGRQDEQIYDQDNVIVSGMSVGLALLFAGQGSEIITDYQIRYFQLGTSGADAIATTDRYELSAAFNSPNYYNPGSSNVITGQHSQIKASTIVTNQPFATIPEYAIQKASKTSVRFNILIDEGSSNFGLPLNEIGLFMANPLGETTEASILVAYRAFTPILKTNDFGLRFIWTISF